MHARANKSRANKAPSQNETSRPSSRRSPSARHPSTHTLLELQQTLGNQATARLLRARLEGDASVSPSVQNVSPSPGQKLSIGATADTAEREADLASDQVMRRAEAQPQSADSASFSEGSKHLKQHPNQERSQPKVKRTQASAASEGAAPPIVHEVLDGPGQPLDPSTRAHMESRFGHDFGRIRVHTDASAARSAREVDALAYTVGRHVVFGQGQYAPQLPEGRRLLAHELTHTIQQGGGILHSRARPGGYVLQRQVAGAQSTGATAAPWQPQQLLSPLMPSPAPVVPFAPATAAPAPPTEPAPLTEEQRKQFAEIIKGDMHDAYTRFTFAAGQVLASRKALDVYEAQMAALIIDVFLGVAAPALNAVSAARLSRRITDFAVKLNLTVSNPSVVAALKALDRDSVKLIVDSMNKWARSEVQWNATPLFGETATDQYVSNIIDYVGLVNKAIRDRLNTNLSSFTYQELGALLIAYDPEATSIGSYKAQIESQANAFESQILPIGESVSFATSAHAPPVQPIHTNLYWVKHPTGEYLVLANYQYLGLFTEIIRFHGFVTEEFKEMAINRAKAKQPHGISQIAAGDIKKFPSTIPPNAAKR